jgi:hypothetical protein
LVFFYPEPGLIEETPQIVLVSKEVAFKVTSGAARNSVVPFSSLLVQQNCCFSVLLRVNPPPEYLLKNS